LGARVTAEEVGMNSADSAGEKQKAGFVDISTLDLYHLLQFFITILNEKAWRYIGLRVDPITGEIETDFERAHVAIDCIRSLVDKLESHLTEDEKNRLRSLITDLQVNYARQVEGKGK
jgi:hypothetical protein